MKQKPVTIKEIARRLNVSVSTISRALHDHPSIGLSTRQQIKKLAAELNYEPNQAAISFKQGKTFTIGAILPNLREEFFSTAINGIEDVATNNKYTVLIGQSHDDMEREIQIADTMRKHRVDGLIVSLSKNTTSFEHFEQLKSIPVVFFDRVPDLPWAYCVSCNLKDSSLKLVDWLVGRGHKLIGFIKGPDTVMSSGERLDGFMEGLKKNGIKNQVDLMVESDLSSQSTETAMKKLLSLKDPPTAVIAFNDYVALDAIRYTRSQGLRINKDICFVSYANLPITSYMDDPPIASVEQFPYEQAEKATNILLKLIGPKVPGPEIEHKLVLDSKVVLNKDLKQ
jgi:LacI family transcriptional regulator